MAETDDLNVGVIGAGHWGKILISTLRRLDGFALVSVASANPETKKLVPDTCNIRSDWRAMTAAPDIEAIIVAAPPALHRDMTLAALQGGKPVFVEKPLTMDPAEAREILAYSRQTCLPVMVDHIHLFSDAFRALKENLPFIGEPYRLLGEAGNQGPIRSDVDALWDWGPHDMSMCLALAGKHPCELAAECVRTELTPVGRGQHIRVHLSYAHGPTCTFEISNIRQDKKRYFVAEGPLGRLVYDDLAPEKLTIERSGEFKAIALDGRMALDNALLAFRKAVISGRDTSGSLSCGVTVTELLHQCAQLLDS